MSQTVYKYVLPFEDVVYLDLPVSAEILHVGAQNGNLCLWARVDPARRDDTTKWTFRIAGTGHPNAEGIYIGTAVFEAQGLVFHVFDARGAL